MPVPTISKPGIYEMSAEDYHADPCVIPSLSSSVAKILVNDTPRHAYTAHPRLNPNFERKEDDKFSIGNSAHSLMLGDPKKFAVGDFDEWRTKEAKEFKAQAYRDGKIPLKAKDWDRVVQMVRIGKDQIELHRDSSDAFTDGKPEQTLIWEEAGTWFRIRLDWLPNDHKKAYYDYKTTETADPVAWQRIVYSVGHDIQAAFYRRGIRALGLNNRPHMKFVVQETADPFALSVVEFNDEALDLASHKLDRAITRWQWCMRSGQWPAYPALTHEMGPPPWHEQQVLDREEKEAAMARRAGVESKDLLELAMKWQAPIEAI